MLLSQEFIREIGTFIHIRELAKRCGIDDEFIGGDLFEKLMNEYVISHPNEFVVDGDYQYSEFVR